MTEESSRSEELVREIEQLRIEAKEQDDRLLRARAELENQRKRGARQIDEARKFALQDFVRQLLPVKDSLEQGLDAAAEDDGEPAGAQRQGIQLTLRLWGEVLANAGVAEIDPVGQIFDPDFHEALSIQPDSGVPPDTILEVAQKGYLLNGRLIRPARVVVAGGEKKEVEAHEQDHRY
jgi:molecular chaperone GrpE